MCGKILQFLCECGSPYDVKNNLVELNILLSLCNGQYVIGLSENNINYFCCYWMLKPEEVETVASGEVPTDVTSGSVVYIVEFGNKAGKKGMMEMKYHLQRKVHNCDGVFWHRYGKGLQIFPHYKIVEGVRQ